MITDTYVANVGAIIVSYRRETCIGPIDGAFGKLAPDVESDFLVRIETTGQTKIRGPNKRCRLRRTNYWPLYWPFGGRTKPTKFPGRKQRPHYSSDPLAGFIS